MRIVSAVLWFLAGSAVAGTIAIHLGLNESVAPLVGIAWAGFVLLDPTDVVWRVGKGSAKVTHGLGSHGAAARPQGGG